MDNFVAFLIFPIVVAATDNNSSVFLQELRMEGLQQVDDVTNGFLGWQERKTNVVSARFLPEPGARHDDDACSIEQLVGVKRVRCKTCSFGGLHGLWREGDLRK